MDWLKAGRALAGIIVSLGFVTMFLAQYVDSTNPKPAFMTAVLFIALIGALLGVDVVVPWFGDRIQQLDTGGDDDSEEPSAKPPPRHGGETPERAPPMDEQTIKRLYQETFFNEGRDDASTTSDSDADSESESGSESGTSAEDN